MSKFIVLAAAGATASLTAIEKADALKLNIFGLSLPGRKKSNLTEQNLKTQGSGPDFRRHSPSTTASNVSKYRTRSVSPISSNSGSAKSAASTVRGARTGQHSSNSNAPSATSGASRASTVRSAKSDTTASSRSAGGPRTVTRSVRLAAGQLAPTGENWSVVTGTYGQRVAVKTERAPQRFEVVPVGGSRDMISPQGWKSIRDKFAANDWAREAKRRC